MAIFTVKYDNRDIILSDEDISCKLKTSGKFMADDITVVADDGLSELNVSYNSNTIITAQDEIGVWKLKCGGKLMNDDVFISAIVSQDDNPYLTFSCPISFVLQASNSAKTWDGTLEYSTDKTTWTEWDGTEIWASLDGKLYLRGTRNTVITGGYRFILRYTYGNPVMCKGNIESLLDYQTVENGGHPTMGAYCFSHMFENWEDLVAAPSLPATALTERCYEYMFRSCSSLGKAPVLSAETLAPHCCDSMFYNCTNLREAPSLPATTLANYCYYAMFMNCTNLSTIPALPATVLENYCYAMMFRNCRNISLTYDSSWGANEYRVPISGTGTSATNALQNMFDGTGGLNSILINTTYYTSNTVV